MGEQCLLLPGVFGLLVQGLLFAVCCGVLAFKYYRFHEGRTLREFLLDSSKQLVGAGWIHVANLLCAVVLGAHFEGDGCTWYWVNIMVDTTAGVYVEYLLLELFTAAAEFVWPHSDDFHTGEYKDASGQLVWEKYAKQLGVWLLCVTFMKFIVVLTMLMLHNTFYDISSAVLSLFSWSPRLELFMVMIVTPCCMNAVQFWLTDNFLRKRSDGKSPDCCAKELVIPNVDGETPWVQCPDEELHKLSAEHVLG